MAPPTPAPIPALAAADRPEAVGEGTLLKRVDEAEYEDVPPLEAEVETGMVELAVAMFPEAEQLDTEAIARAGPAVMGTWP